MKNSRQRRHRAKGGPVAPNVAGVDVSPVERPQGSSRATGVRVLLVLDVVSGKIVREHEVGAVGPSPWNCLPDLRRILREEWDRLSSVGQLASLQLLIEAVLDLPSAGLSADHASCIRDGFARNLRILANNPSTAIQSMQLDGCRIDVFAGTRSLVDRFARLWQASLADSPVAIWSQSLAPDPSLEESVMSKASSTESSLARLSVQSVFDAIEALDREVSNTLSPFRARLQGLLDQLAGVSFGSFSENQLVADKLRDLLLRLGLRVRCPREGCSEPALIRCRPAGRTRAGSFEFEHIVEGRVRTHAASTKLPHLEVVAAVPHRRRKPRKRPG